VTESVQLRAGTRGNGGEPRKYPSPWEAYANALQAVILRAVTGETRRPQAAEIQG
jgi:hypothetical protein